MPKLIGKNKASARRKARLAAKQVLKHHHASGEPNFLCGVPYNSSTAARTSNGVSCVTCRRTKELLLATELGRQRLGLTPLLV